MNIDIEVQEPQKIEPIEISVSTGASYPILTDKPQINGVELIGNKTAEDLGLQPQGDYISRGEINIDGSISGDGFATKEELNKKANKSDLSTVAFSGNYSDLKNRPTIPSVPTKTSQLTNDSGFLTQHQNISHLATKTELANKQDKGDYALKSEIPTRTSSLTNDSGFLTQHQDISGKQDKLTAGENITIVDNVISATNSGGGVGNADLSNYATKQFAKDSSFPSTHYDELTLAASGTDYVAPANGWFCLQKVSGKDYAWVYITTSTFSYAHEGYNKSVNISCVAPCLKGEVARIGYDATGKTLKFRFIYAQGEVE